MLVLAEFLKIEDKIFDLTMIPKNEICLVYIKVSIKLL